MNEQSPVPGPEPMSRREVRRLPPADPSRGDAWIIGIILILLGGLFLMRTMGTDIPLTNWWALFLLIPAFGALSAAWRMYREADHG